MSLKAFHIFFIVLSVATSAGFALWLLQQYLRSGAGIYILFAALSFAVAVSLVWYGIRFVRKLKHVSYL